MPTVAAAASQSCALLSDGTARCWGRNESGSLGFATNEESVGTSIAQLGSALPPIDLGPGERIVDIQSGASTFVNAAKAHTCALLATGRIKCWGFNGGAQLGTGGTAKHDGATPESMGVRLPNVNFGEGRRAVSMAVGGDHNCAVLDNGKVKCWGMNVGGQLGVGTTKAIGFSESELGDAWPSVDLGQGRTAKSVAVGASHSCAILDTDQVKCWGYNGSGQLGLGDTTIRGTTAASMGDALGAVDLGTGRTARAIAAGRSTTCVITDDGKVKCWGANDEGKAGRNDKKADIGKVPSDMGDALVAVDFGVTAKATRISVGDAHACAILEGGALYCWGLNGLGALGQGDTVARGDGTVPLGASFLPVKLGQGEKARSVALGYHHTCVGLESGAVKCFGNNYNGQLGIGSTDAKRGTVPEDMGDALVAVKLR